jgi:hypothetical protein
MLLKKKLAVLVLVGAGTISTAALAEESGVTGCLHMRKEASQALDAHQQSPNFGDARNLVRAGQEFCQAGLYDKGLQRFSKALDLLGTSKAFDVPGTKKS